MFQMNRYDDIEIKEVLFFCVFLLVWFNFFSSSEAEGLNLKWQMSAFLGLVNSPYKEYRFGHLFSFPDNWKIQMKLDLTYNFMLVYINNNYEIETWLLSA